MRNSISNWKTSPYNLIIAGRWCWQELIDTFASMEQTPAARIQHVENDGAEPNDFPKIQFKFIHLS